MSMVTINDEWTIDEIIFLRKNWGQYTVTELSKKFKRKKDDIRNMIDEMDLRGKNDNSEDNTITLQRIKEHMKEYDIDIQNHRDIAELIHFIRETIKFKQSTIAEKIRCSPSTYRTYEKCISEVPLYRFMKIINLYNEVMEEQELDGKRTLSENFKEWKQNRKH